MPHGGRPGRFVVTLVHVLPPSRVSCTRPSFVPTQISPFSRGDSAMPKHDAGVLDADVVGGEPARAALPGLVVEREVGGDHLPALAAVGACGARAGCRCRSCCCRAARCAAARPTRSGTSRLRRAGRSTAAARPPRCGTAAGPPRSARRCRRPSPSPTPSTRPASSWSDRASPSRSRRRRPSATSRARCRRRRRSRWPARLLRRAAVRRLVLLVAEHVVGDLVVHGDVVDLRVERGAGGTTSGRGSA